MPAQPSHKPVRVGSAAAILAAVPHLLGFHPDSSLVIIGSRRQQIGVTFRFDLPDPPGRDAAHAIAAHAVWILTRQRCTTAVVIGYGPGRLVTPIADALQKMIAGTGLTLPDILRVQDGRFWSYLCTDLSCCPAEGVPFDPAAHDVSAALAAGSGQPVLSSRDDLAAQIAPVTGPAAQTMRRETALAEQAAARLLADSTRSATTARPVIDRGLDAVQDAITVYRNGGTIQHASEFAWLALALTTLRVRDDAWARMDPAHRDAHQKLWTDLTRHAPPGYIAAPASLLAFTAWQAGNGALANLALDRALADDPAYSMAHLLRDALTAGAPPSLATLPMTPEEVAASYDKPETPQQAGQDGAGAGEDHAS
jgi:hypothetical protein